LETQLLISNNLGFLRNEEMSLVNPIRISNTDVKPRFNEKGKAIHFSISGLGLSNGVNELDEISRMIIGLIKVLKK
jgi:hypothetical protein